MSELQKSQSPGDRESLDTMRRILSVSMLGDKPKLVSTFDPPKSLPQQEPHWVEDRGP
jgi:hypothetical protein